MTIMRSSNECSALVSHLRGINDHKSSKYGLHHTNYSNMPSANSTSSITSTSSTASSARSNGVHWKAGKPASPTSSFQGMPSAPLLGKHITTISSPTSPPMNHNKEPSLMSLALLASSHPATASLAQALLSGDSQGALAALKNGGNHRHQNTSAIVVNSARLAQQLAAVAAINHSFAANNFVSYLSSSSNGLTCLATSNNNNSKASSVAVPQQQSTLATSTTTKKRHNPIPLFMDCDEDSLSEYQCLIRKQIELFEADFEEANSSVQGRNKQVVEGQVGIRCRHCTQLPPRQRQRGCMYFPTKLDRIYQAAQNLSAFHLVEHCKNVPEDVRHKIKILRLRKSPAGGGKRYWGEGVRCQGVIEDAATGLRFH